MKELRTMDEFHNLEDKTNPQCRTEDKQSEISKLHNTYMKQLHEWQKMCNFHYIMCWQYHSMQMVLSRRQMTTTGTSVLTPSTRVAELSPPNPRLEFRPAPILYRLLAEVIDFLILMAVKVFGIMFYTKLTGTSIENISYQFLLSDEMSADDMTIEDLRYMMLMGLVYRVLACLYEAAFVALSGATPGKMMLGLEVVTCRACVSIQRGNRKYLSVYPGHTPSLANSWVRSLIKNFSITFLMPAFLTVFFYQYNRTSYDIVANTIVVKNDAT